MKTNEAALLLENGRVLVGAPSQRTTHNHLFSIAGSLGLEIACSGYLIEDWRENGSSFIQLEFLNVTSLVKMQLHVSVLIEVDRPKVPSP